MISSKVIFAVIALTFGITTFSTSIPKAYAAASSSDAVTQDAKGMQCMDGMKSMMEDMEGKMEDMKGKMENMKGKMENMKGKMGSMKGKMGNMKGKMGNMKSTMEDMKGKNGVGSTVMK